MTKLVYFNTGVTADSESSPLEKRACLFYAAGGDGVHKDSKGRVHKVDEDYLRQLETNTNQALANGETIYLINNHKKDDFNSACGYLDSNVYVKEINQQDAEDNPKLKKLIGRLALFADKIKVTGTKIKQQIQEGLKFPNISVGLDMAAMRLKEISLTCMPALVNASMFNEYESEFAGAVTMAEVLQSQANEEDNKEKAHELLDVFLTVTKNLKYCRDEDLTGGTREAYYQNAIQDFTQKLAEVTDIGPDPGYASQTAVQDNINREHTYAQENGRPQIIGYSEQVRTNNFSMADTEKAPFTMAGAEADFFIQIGRRPEEKKSNPIMGAAKTLGTVGLAAAGLRYGKKAVKGAMRARKAGATVGQSIGAGAAKAGRAAKVDLGRARRGMQNFADPSKMKKRRRYRTPASLPGTQRSGSYGPVIDVTPIS